MTRQLVHAFCNDESLSPWPPAAHFLQGHLSSDHLVGMLRVSTAVWHVRCVISRGYAFASREDLTSHLYRCLSDPLFHGKEVRQRRVITPLPRALGAVLYRTDGAARGQGQEGATVGGAGVAFFGVGETVIAWMCESLGNVTNNIAEYVAVLCALQRAERLQHHEVVVESDSMLVTRQLRGEWRVMCDQLKPFYRDCMSIMSRVRRVGHVIELRHIYREYNLDADALANRGADGHTDSLMW